jgi:hypothetical protein
MYINNGILGQEVLVCDENIFCTKRGLSSSRAESLLCVVLESEIWVEYYSSNTETHFLAQYCCAKKWACVLFWRSGWHDALLRFQPHLNVDNG